MAGRGTRLLPHTAMTSKPLFKILEKPIVHLLIQKLHQTIGLAISQLAFILNAKDEETEKELIKLSETLEINLAPLFFYQEETLGTAHAIWQAKSFLSGPVIIAFSDTLFDLKDKINLDKDIIVYTKKVKDPKNFGVVELDSKTEEVINFIEKPQTFISDSAIIGIYYFKKSELILRHLKELIEQNTLVNGEYQFTDVLTKIKNNGTKVYTVQVDIWLDCGNKKHILDTHNYYLSKTLNHIPKSIAIKNSKLIEPVYIGDNVIIENSIIGPFVSIAKDSKIKNCIINSSIIQEKTQLNWSCISNSILGKEAKYSAKPKTLNLGAFCFVEE